MAARTILSTRAIEKGTYIIGVAFTDENGDSVIPNAGATWTLTDVSGNVINNRNAVGITEAASVDIVLSGNDLAIGANGRKRVLTVFYTYDSDAGNDLPMYQECEFTIADLLTVS